MIGIAEGKQIKSSMLPAYCDPPNPCPLGYTAQVIVVLVVIFFGWLHCPGWLGIHVINKISYPEDSGS